MKYHFKTGQVVFRKAVYHDCGIQHNSILYLFRMLWHFCPSAERIFRMLMLKMIWKKT